MKRLTEREFIDRTEALLRAKKIFIDSGITNNITLAFELYQGVLAEQEREIFLSVQVYGSRPRSPFDRFERPECPDCGTEMMFRVVPVNEQGIKTQLVCSNIHCDTVLDSENDLKWWMENLRIKDEGSSEGTEKV